MSLQNHAACTGEDCDAVLSGEVVISAAILEVIAASHRGFCPTLDHPKRTESKNRRSRLVREGRWYYSASLCRSADRDWLSPGIRNTSLGFRVLLSSVK